MSNYDIDEFNDKAVKDLTSLLSLSPIVGNGTISEEWLEKQRENVKKLPQACLRPALTDPIAVIMRGLILASERRDLPFVPMAAILCKAHKRLHPWRLRSLFLLLASEVGMKSDRIRRHKGFYGLPPSQSVKDFVYRMTSIASLWVHPDDFERRFGFRAKMFPFIESGCEACILALVGARGELLVDLRANLVARHNTFRLRYQAHPALLRFIDAWIEWFGEDKELMIKASDQLALELQTIREVSYRERKKRRDAKTKLREAGKKIADPARYHPRRLWEIERPERNPVPRRASFVEKPDHVADNPKRPSTATGDDRPGLQAFMPGGRSARVEDWRRQMADHLDAANLSGDDAPGSPAPHSPMPSPRTVTFNDQREGDGEEEHATDWADEVGSYYFTRDEPPRDTINNTSKTEDESNANPGARANWKNQWPSVKPSGPVHPALRQSVLAVKTTNGKLSVVGTGKPGAPKEELSTPEKLRNWFWPAAAENKGDGAAWASNSRRPSTAGTSPSRHPSVSGSTRSRRSLNTHSRRPSVAEPESSAAQDKLQMLFDGTLSAKEAAAGPSMFNTGRTNKTTTAQSNPSTPPISLPPPNPNSPRGPGGYGNFWLDDHRPRGRYQPSVRTVSDLSDRDGAPGSGSIRSEWTGVSVQTTSSNYSQPPERTVLSGLVRGEKPGEVHGGMRSNYNGSVSCNEATIAILEGRVPVVKPPERMSVRQMMEDRFAERERRDREQGKPPRPSAYESLAFRNPFMKPLSRRGSDATERPPRASSSVYSSDSPGGVDRGRSMSRSRRESRAASRSSRTRVDSSGTSLGMFMRGQDKPVRPDDSISAVEERRQREEAEKQMGRKPRGLDMLFRRDR